MIRLIPAAVLLLPGLGCQSMPLAKSRPSVDPALPMSMSRDELVDYLNQQSGNLHSWKSSQVKMKVRMPRMLPVTLTGSMVCESPNRFRLTASGALVHADLGANSERCWVYVKPGGDGVVSWRHEDAHLLEQLPEGIPYIDPDWLMEVLGVVPLEPESFVIAEGPLPASRQLWLASAERTPSGRILRRVIKVDTVRGVIDEHTIYDDDDRVVVRALLSDHQPSDSHLIPRQVDLDFPGMDAQLSLTFSKIETNPQIASSLWDVPAVRGGRNIDVGQLIAERNAELHHVDQRMAPVQHTPSPQETKIAELLPEPDWDSPAEDSPTESARQQNFARPAVMKSSASRKKTWFRSWW